MMTLHNPDGSTTDVLELAVCTDCLFYGEYGPDGLDELCEDPAAVAEGFALNEADGWRYASGCPAEHGHEDGEDHCEPWFSWTPCDLCRSPLGGDRHPAMLVRVNR